MKQKPVIRILTLIVFISLLSGYVAYKAGAFEGNPGEHSVVMDSPKKDSVSPAVMAPSSKSDVIFEPQTTEDTSKPKAVKQQSNQSAPASQNNNANQAAPPANQGTSPAPKRNVYLGSSKSAPVFTPTPDTSKPK